MSLRELKRSIRPLPRADQMKLDAWLREVINRGVTKYREHTSGKRGAVHVSYHLERVRCGKENCKCSKGELHGPYWYAYWSEGGKVRSQYIGKRLPKGVKPSKSSKSRGVR